MARSLGLVRLIKIAFPHVVPLARFTRVPIVSGIVDRMLFDGDDIMYLPRDRAIKVNRSIDRPDEMVLPSSVVECFIEKANYHWIMDSCICRDSMNCENYPIDLGCLFLGEATLGINPKLGRRVTRDEALAHVGRCREAGLVHMVGRNKLDSVWLNVGPGEKLLTVCNCCPCCCLWRILPHIASRIGNKVTRMPGISVTVNDRCVGCGECAQNICFVGAIQMVDGLAVIGEECRGCGLCVSVCPQEAIEISVANEQFVEESVRRLDSLVNVT